MMCCRSFFILVPSVEEVSLLEECPDLGGTY
jgi:hypothetical protein